MSLWARVPGVKDLCGPAKRARDHSRTARRRAAFAITLTEDRAIAASFSAGAKTRTSIHGRTAFSASAIRADPGLLGDHRGSSETPQLAELDKAVADVPHQASAGVIPAMSISA